MVEVQAPEPLGRPVERPPQSRRSGGTRIAGKFIRRDEVAALVQDGTFVDPRLGGGRMNAAAAHNSGGGTLTIEANGSEQTLVSDVDQITFSGAQAISMNQKILYVTERGVFELRPDGVHLIEIAPGINVEAEILNRMAFRPAITAPIRIMSSAHFTEHKQ